MKFVEKLRRIQRKHNSLLCIGLDTDVSKVPEFLYAYGDPQFEFNRRIIDATKDLVCAYKMNVAFYESAGEHGWYTVRSEEHTSELQSRLHLVCRLLLEKKKKDSKSTQHTRTH